MRFAGLFPRHHSARRTCLRTRIRARAHDQGRFRAASCPLSPLAAARFSLFPGILGPWQRQQGAVALARTAADRRLTPLRRRVDLAASGRLGLLDTSTRRLPDNPRHGGRDPQRGLPLSVARARLPLVITSHHHVSPLHPRHRPIPMRELTDPHIDSPASDRTAKGAPEQPDLL